MDKEILLLFKKYVNGTCNQQELDEVFAIMDNGKFNSEWSRVMDDEIDQLLSSDIQSELSKEEADKIYAGISKQLISEKTKLLKFWRRFGQVAAAVLLLILGALAVNQFVINNNSTEEYSASSPAFEQDIRPGKVGATLTLSNGEQIELGTIGEGKLADESGVVISKNASGELVYEISSTYKGEAAQNTLSTEKGQTYKVQLPDGSSVWLNAASSLTYSTRFNDAGVRKVKLTGEAFFDVTSDKERPFIVESKGQDVEVLGTQFNINTYEDNKEVKTTLVEGRVKLTILETVKSHILTPGLQLINRNGQAKIQPVNTDLVVAWKADKFTFDLLSIQEIMPMIARWYDLEVIYTGEIPTQRFWGSISRYEDISKVLSILSATENVAFKIEGKTIYVSKP